MRQTALVRGGRLMGIGGKKPTRMLRIDNAGMTMPTAPTDAMSDLVLPGWSLTLITAAPPVAWNAEQRTR